MEYLFEYFDGSLMVLALVLFLATLLVIFFLLSREANQRRMAFIDRRRNKEPLIFPFYDSEHIFVVEERRLLTDRRKPRAIHVSDLTV